MVNIRVVNIFKILHGYFDMKEIDNDKLKFAKIL